MDIFEEALVILNTISKKSNIHKATLSRLSSPELITTVNFPVLMDNGDIKIFTGYRSRYSTILGSAKGGIRFHHKVNLSLVSRLAFEMMIKCAIAGIPFGGGKGGVILDTSTVSNSELERIARGYIKAIAYAIGTDIDVPAPDVGTNATILGYMIDEYEKVKNVKEPAVLTGKPIHLGGSLFRTEATGFGVANITNLFVKKLGKQPQDMKIAVQGFGNVGSFANKFLSELGFKIVAISDVGGGFYNENGIDVNAVFNAYYSPNNKTKSLYDDTLHSITKDYKKIANNDLLELKVDILIPAAIDGVITVDNVNKVKATYIVEGANAPINDEANSILEQKNIQIVPDVLATSGGVIVSYFEWYQNKHNEKWEETKVKARLTEHLQKAFDNMYAIKDKQQEESLRTCAYLNALDLLDKAFLKNINIKG
jgi:glutamate dehydrogenase (NADP+)